MADLPALKRPAFFDGQRLEAADLTHAAGFHRELRWLHNRSLHNWGIAFGYAVSGRRKERIVRVQPGFALDCDGHELILAEALDVAIPPVAGAAGGGPRRYHLTVSYTEDGDLAPETRGGSCGASGAVRLPERVTIRWQEPNEFRYGHDVVLGSIAVSECRLAEDFSGAARRDALPETQPYVAAGQTVPGQTGWRHWPNDTARLGVAATVSTTSAGFRNVPSYQAHVIGSRIFNVDLVFDGYAQVLAPTASGFELVVLLPEGRLSGSLLNAAGDMRDTGLAAMNSTDPQKNGLGWYVAWMGLEG